MRSPLSRWLVLLGLLGASLSFGAGALAQPPADEATFRQLELFARVLSYIQNNYVEKTDQRALIYGAIKGMVDTLDPHTVFMPPEVFKEMKIDTSGEYGGVGLELVKKDGRLRVVAPLEDTPAARAGLKAGDELVQIDGEPTSGMDVARASQLLRGPAGSRVSVLIMREGFQTPQEITLLRDHIRIVSVESSLYDGIGYVKIKNFQDRTDLYLHRQLDRLRRLNGDQELKGVVLDLRNDPGGLLDQAVAVADRFLPGNLVIVTTKGRGGQNITEERSKDADTENPYPMVVLVNGGSASASEIVAGALQDHARALVMGTQTFGKGSVQTVIELEDGSGLKLTIARYYTPSGRSIQERGITPDFVIPDSPDSPAADRDGIRERDLRHHFKAEGAAPTARISEQLPAHLNPWPALEAKLKDRPLVVALEYLRGLAQPPALPKGAVQASMSP